LSVEPPVQDLERTLGIILLDRSTRPLVVNAAGQLYSDFCRDVLRLEEEFGLALETLKQDVDGTVRVASIYSIGLSEMSRLQEEFSARYPTSDLQVEYMRPDRIYDAVREGSADLGLVSYPESSRDITVIPWRQEEMVLAASPYHALAAKGRVAPQDITATIFHCLGYDPQTEIHDTLGRPLPLSRGEPIRQVLA